MSNVLTNPGFETNTTGWTLTNGTLARVTTPVHSGAGAGRLTASASGQVHLSSGSFACAAGQTITASIWARTAATARGCQIGISWYGSSGYISTDGSGTFANDSTTYAQYTCTATAPAGTTSAVLEYYVNSAAASEIHYVDDAVLDVPDTSLTISGTGSLTLGGSASMVLKFPLTASGVVSLAGTSEVSLKFPLTAAGATALSGSAGLGLKFPLAAAGGITLAGSGEAGLSFPVTATGGLALAGAATVAGDSPTITATGILTLSGSANVGLTVDLGGASGAVSFAGSATLTVQTGHLFRPPTVRGLQSIPPERLFSYFKLDEGLTVLKDHDGFYTQVTYPTQDGVDAAAAAYIGGHVYEVSDDEWAALQAAGYGDGTYTPPTPPDDGGGDTGGGDPGGGDTGGGDTGGGGTTPPPYNPFSAGLGSVSLGGF